MTDSVNSEHTIDPGEHAHRPRRVESTAPQHTEQDNDQEQTTTAERQGAHPDSLLGDPSLDGRGNAPMRAAVMLEAQQTLGNRAMVRYLQRTTGSLPATAEQPGTAQNRRAEFVADSLPGTAQRSPVGGPVLQRQPTPGPPANDVTDTDAAGVTRTHPKAGWNKGEAKFDKKGWTRGITRHKITGLTGVKQPADDSSIEPTHDEDDLGVGDKDRTVSDITDEKDEGAVLLLPGQLTATEAKGVDVFLWLHGHGIGMRERKNQRWDEGHGPGEKTVTKIEDKKKKNVPVHPVKGMEPGTVRDVDVDHMEEQLGDHIKSSGRPAVAVLAQGSHSTMPQFGANFNIDAYINEVFQKASAQVPKLKSITLSAGRVVVGGHSGAGNTIAPLLGRVGEKMNEAKDGKWGAAKEEAELKKIGWPSNIAEVVLFDSIWFGDKEGKAVGYESSQGQAVGGWIKAEIAKDIDSLKGKPDKDWEDQIKKNGMRFRGYYSKNGSYADLYIGMKKDVHAAITRKIKELDAEKPPPDAAAKKAVEDVLRDNYELGIKEVGSGHEEIIGHKDPGKKGNIEETLDALPPVQPSRASLAPVQRTPLAVQRDPTTPDPDKAQWEADWNDPAFKNARANFDENGRPSGTPKERYDILCPLYKRHHIDRPLQYLTNEINYSTVFFGSTTHAHTGMQALLSAAENSLKAMKDDKGQPKYPGSPFKEKPWALTVRTTSTGVWSNHADGKAIDLDPDSNPHLLDAGHRAVITALTGMDIEKSNPGKAAGLDSYDADKMASDRFQSSYSEDGMNKRIEELKPAEEKVTKERDDLANKQTQLAEAKKQISKDRDAIVKSKSATAQERSEARDKAKAATALLDKQSAEVKAQLTAKNSELKEAHAPIQTLEDELKRFKAEQKRFDTVNAAVTTAEDAVRDSSTEVATLSTELDAAQKKLDPIQQQVDAAQAQLGKAKKADRPELKKALDDLKRTLTDPRKERDAKKAALTKAQAILKKQEKTLSGSEEKRDAFTLRKYGREGFLNLPKDVVTAMKAAGFKWGGDWGSDSNGSDHKDMMHFDMP